MFQIPVSEFNVVNEDSNASFPSPAPPSDDSQGADDSLQSFPDKQKERKRTNSGGNGMYWCELHFPLHFFW